MTDVYKVVNSIEANREQSYTVAHKKELIRIILFYMTTYILDDMSLNCITLSHCVTKVKSICKEYRNRSIGGY